MDIHKVMDIHKLIGSCKWLKIFDKSKPPDAKLANGGFALAKILHPSYYPIILSAFIRTTDFILGRAASDAKELLQA